MKSMKLNNSILVVRTVLNMIKNVYICNEIEFKEKKDELFREEILCTVFSIDMSTAYEASFEWLFKTLYIEFGFNSRESFFKTINEFYKIDEYKYQIEEFVLSNKYFFNQKLLPYIPVPRV